MVKKTETEKKYYKLFNQYVPDIGKCDTLGGEIIRAFAKINYRWYNAGDKFWEGYGIETCGSSAFFLAENGFKSHIESMVEIYNNKEYDNKLIDLFNQVINYVEQHSEVFTIKNNQDSVCGFMDEADDKWGIYYNNIDWA